MTAKFHHQFFTAIVIILIVVSTTGCGAVTPIPTSTKTPISALSNTPTTVPSPTATLVTVPTSALSNPNTVSFTLDGSFPGGEYRLIIKNQKGKAIEDAALWVNSDRVDIPMQSYEYPIDNFYFNERLASNAQGVIIAYHIPLYPVEFKATCWKPFWAFKYCKDIPKYWFVITADGYKPTTLSSDILFEMQDAAKNGVAKTSVNYYDRTFELPVYERIIILENK